MPYDGTPFAPMENRLENHPLNLDAPNLCRYRKILLTKTVKKTIVPVPRRGNFSEISMIRIGFVFFFLFPVGLCAQTILDPSCMPTPTFSEAFRQFGNRERDRIFTDYSNLYNRNNALNFGVALLGAGVLANTKLDGDFQRWYGNHIRSGFTNDFSKGAKIFGEGVIFLPVMTASALTYRFWQEKQGLPDCQLGNFTDRTFRGYFAGAPTLLIGQLVLGGDRPRDGSSYWRPFRQDHGISGHAFLGAVPFITAAQTTDQPYAKGVFYVLSTFTAWSRVNDDAHYLSQIALGWYLAYLSVRAVSETEGHRPLPKGLTIFPVSDNRSVGVGVHYQY